MNFYRLKIIGNNLDEIEKTLQFSNEHSLDKDKLRLILNETNNSKDQLDNLIESQPSTPNNELSSKLNHLYNQINYIKSLTNDFLN